MEWIIVNLVHHDLNIHEIITNTKAIAACMFEKNGDKSCFEQNVCRNNEVEEVSKTFYLQQLVCFIFILW